MALAWDQFGTRSLNQINHRPIWSRFFGSVSRLGDGIFWYVLMALLPLLDGYRGLETALVMLGAGACCTGVYKAVKHGTARPRPCEVDGDLLVTTLPLDRFSFPSGHTLHAVCFTGIAVEHLAWLGLLLYPFSVLVALSRLVLGLHYPSDVLTGAAIGGGIALLAVDLL